MRTHLLFPLLFLSGIAGLTYETVWLHLLKTMTGATLPALSITLATFMAGLSLGSFAGGSIRSFRLHPGLQFGLAEGGLALCSWMSLMVFFRTESLLPSSLAARCLFGALMTIPIPFLMGFSFPLALRALSGEANGPGSISGKAYFANTLGGAAGAFLTGFMLIERTGILHTLFIASGVNLLVGLTAILLFHKERFISGPSSDPALAEPSPSRIPILLYGLFGFAVMACEILWIRILDLRFLSTVYGFTLTLSVLLSGIAIGGALFKVGLDRKDAAFLRSLFLVLLIGFSITIPLSAFILFRGPIWGPISSFSHLLAAETTLTAAGLLLPSILSGFLFPLAVRVLGSGTAKAHASAGRLYAVNTLGGMAATLMVPFLLIPAVGLAKSLALICSGTGVLLPLFLLLPQGTEIQVRRGLAFLVTLPIAAAILFWGFSFQRDEQMRERTLLYYHEAPALTVAVARHRANGYRELIVNGVRTEGGTNPEALQSQRAQIDLPVMLSARPESILVLGLGTGISLGALADHPEVVHADCIEISPEIAEASRYFNPENRSILRNPRVTLHAADGRHFVNTTAAKYDVVVGDLFFPWQKGGGSLYTKEHFSACRRLLKPDGIVCQWLPLYQLSPENFGIIANTFASVFQRTELWIGHVSADKPAAALVGFRDPARPAPDRAGPLLSRFVCRISHDPALPVESDLHPRTEYAAARDFFSQEESNRRFAAYLAGQFRSPAPLYPDLEKQRAYLSALFHSFGPYLAGDPARSLLRLDSLVSADSTLPHAEFLLPGLCRQIHDKNLFEAMPRAAALLARVTARYDADYALFGFLGKFRLLEKDYAGCISACGSAVRLNPLDEQALLNLGVCFAMSGSDSLAVAAWQRVLSINPGNTEASYNIMINRSRTRK